MDRKNQSVGWVYFEDKRVARSAARKGINLGSTKCSIVRVKPNSMEKPGEGRRRGERGGLVVRGLPNWLSGEFRRPSRTHATTHNLYSPLVNPRSRP